MIARIDRRSVVRVCARGALMPAAALLVHELRYLLAFGSPAGLVLTQQGHSYLSSVAPWVICTLGAAVGAFLWSLGRALAGQRSVPRYTLSLAALWLVCATCLVAIYVAQELLEGLLATGHPAGFVGVFGYGGWWSIPAAMCVGLVLATILHGARWVLDEVATRCAPRAAAARVRVPTVLRPRDAVPRTSAALAAGWSLRGPPY
jgi:hypothetical protein